MKNLKRKVLIFGLLVGAMSIVACNNGGGGDNGKKMFTVTFDANGGTPTPAPQKVEKGGKVTEPEQPTRVDEVKGEYKFVEWRNGSSTWSFKNSKVNKDITLTAKWLPKYAVSFKDASGADISPVSYVDRGSTLSKPADPAAPSGQAFYGWMNVKNGGQIWNFDNEYLNQVMDDVEFTPLFVAAGLQPQYFEAEQCRDITEFAPQLDDEGNQKKDDNGNLLWVEMPGATYSGGAKGGQLIQPDFYVDGKSEYGSSGNYTSKEGKQVAAFVHFMYAEGDTLTWKVNSDVAATNVTLFMRLSGEYGLLNEENELTYSFTDEMFQVKVNDEALSYGKVALHNLIDKEFIPFQDYLVSAAVSLKAGENIIQMKVNNHDSLNGTIAATSPCVDCIKLYSSSTLTWPDAKMEQVASL